jgi:cobalamin synthase
MRRALAFLTPLLGAAEPRPETLGWFPFVGAALGLALGGVWWGAARLWPTAVAAAVVVAADLALTGSTDLVDVTDLGLDRFDEHGRSRLDPDPIALPFPDSTR